MDKCKNGNTGWALQAPAFYGFGADDNEEACI